MSAIPSQTIPTTTRRSALRRVSVKVRTARDATMPKKSVPTASRTIASGES